MLTLLASLIPLLFSTPDVRELAFEKLALRQQLAVMKTQCPRPRLQIADRLFWIWLSRIWPHWRRALLLVRPGSSAGIGEDSAFSGPGFPCESDPGVQE